MGRPIQDDEGVGGAIYFDEGLNSWDADLDVDTNVHSNIGASNHSGFQNQQKTNGNINSMPFPQQQRAQPQAVQNNSNNHARFTPNHTHTSVPSKPVTTAAISATTTTTSVSPPSDVSNYQQIAARSVLPKQNVGQGQNLQNKVSTTERPKENQPVHPAPSNTQARRASMGGFHFPPGMVIHYLNFYLKHIFKNAYLSK